MNGPVKTFRIISLICFMTVSVLGVLFFLKDPIKSYAADTSIKGNVLFISSYHYGFETVPYQLKGIEQAFENTGIHLDVEFMDTKRYPTDENYENFYQLLKYKMDQGLAYDVILIGDDNGLQFMMDHTDLYEDIPKIYFCINDFDRANTADELENYTGIVEAISVSNNLSFAKSLFPSATEFVAIVDNTQTGIGDKNSFLSMEENFPDMKFTLLNTSEMTMEEIEEDLENMTQDQILFYLAMFEDGTGQTYTIDQAVSILVEHAKIPVFRMSIGGVEEGLLGGEMVSYTQQGFLAGNMAIEVLGGVSADSIEQISESPNLYYLNYEVWEQYGLDKALVPEDVMWINKPISFYERYKKIFLPVGLTLTALLTIILISLIDNYRQRKLRKEIQENRDEISSLYEEISATEEELRQHYEQLISTNEALELSENRYREIAYKDLLTGIPNRNYIIDHLTSEIEKMKWNGMLFCFDLDNFKYLNDYLGHDMGDEILISISQKLKKIESESLKIARLGGDEFAILFIQKQSRPETQEEQITRIKKQIEKAIDVENCMVELTASIGVSKFPQQGILGVEILKKADIAMYKAKENGRNRIEIYDSSMEINIDFTINMQKNLTRALKMDEFMLYYQPQFLFSDNKMCGAECLLRWNTPKNGIMMPGKFIAIAERLGFIQNIGKTVQEKAMHFIKENRELISEGFHISINVSALELRSENFLAYFMKFLKKYEIDPKNIALEITESILLESIQSSFDTITQIREKGVEIHLDDFGTGYSSLTYLIKLPFDVVKIDRSFVEQIEENPEQKHLVESIITIIHNLNKKVVVEGIETKGQFEIFKELGCDMIQGYYLARPMPQELFITELETMKKTQ